jgi:hypothetical protein
MSENIRHTPFSMNKNIFEQDETQAMSITSYSRMSVKVTKFVK